METLFENKDIKISLTGHDYDIVGTIEVKSKASMTFFFRFETDEDGEILEDTTTLVDVRFMPIIYDYYEVQDIAAQIDATDFYAQCRQHGEVRFLSDPQDRGQFLALVKHYCPEQLSKISWA